MTAPTIDQHIAAKGWLDESPTLRNYGGQVIADVAAAKVSHFAIGRGMDRWFDLEWTGKSWKVTLPNGDSFRRRDNADAVPDAIAALKAQGWWRDRA